MRTLTLWALLLGTANAADLTLNHTVRLVDGMGTPYQTTATVRIQLQTAESPSPVQIVWDRTFSNAPLEDGYLSLSLALDDDGDAIDSDWMSAPLWLVTTVNGQVLGTPQRLTQSPSAGFATHAMSATTAGTATSVSTATNATSATRATQTQRVNLAASPSGPCTPGSVVFDTVADLLVTCDAAGAWRSLPADLLDGDTNTTYAAGPGLSLSGTTFSVDTSRVQQAASYNALVRVQAHGLSTPIGASRVDINGVSVFAPGRSFGLTAIRLSDGVVTFTGTYDLHGFVDEAGLLATKLDTYGTDHLLIVSTFDEPQSNHLEQGLDDAMYRCGASIEVYGAPMVRRAAYIMVGICGQGEGSGLEVYSGDEENDPTAAVEYAFWLRDGVWMR